MTRNPSFIVSSVVGLLLLAQGVSLLRSRDRRLPLWAEQLIEEGQAPVATGLVVPEASKQSKMSFGMSFGKVRTFPPFHDVTRIVVRHHSKEVQTINNPQALRRIVDFMNLQLKGWEVPWYGVPVPAWDVGIYSRDIFLGSFGAGETFFETQREGGFFSMKWTPIFGPRMRL